ncbi:methylitaconate delta2-delta3-isomerase [Podospora didyma]|uniref:Methylitaconate delta2-delta3-isomerase n=1 Tax=Podospora didyma TaxID=330526 RepID=A0AAE0K253_9PEZI|nr:methylitaconate delta2-delta3-isomerase [Podospora didyma]
MAHKTQTQHSIFIAAAAMPRREAIHDDASARSRHGPGHGQSLGPVTGQPRSFPAIFGRGGTSNGLVIFSHHLPPATEWSAVLPAAMGSPDAYGRQLDGMGSGISSTSKICVLSPTSRPDADVEFTFVQVGIKDGSLDMAGNCGNMSSIIGPVSFDEGMARDPTILAPDSSHSFPTALVRIFNTNTSKIIHSRFRVTGEPPRFCPRGDYSMDGVPGRHSKIVLSFIRPGGAKTGRTLPTGNAVDTLTLPDGTTIQASLIDVSNPGVFVRVSDVASESRKSLDPPSVEADPVLKSRLEQIRQAGATLMGLDPKTESVPKIVLVFPPSSATPCQTGTRIRCLALSMGQAHKAVPLTLALCLGAAARIPGTIPNQLAAGDGKGDIIDIRHPSGSLDVGTIIADGEIQSAELHRTARVLMKGEVFYE